MPQFDYNHPVFINGQVADSGPRQIDSFRNEATAQADVITSAAAPGAGLYEVQVSGEEGVFTFEYTSPGGEAPADIIAGLEADASADSNFFNIAVFTDSAPDLDIDYIHPSQSYQVTFLSNPGGNMSLASTAAGGADIGLGLCVVQGTGPKDAVLPGAGSVTADFVGFTVRNVEMQINDGVQTSVDRFTPGAILSVARKGKYAVLVEDAVTANTTGFMRIQNPVVGGVEAVGRLRSDADGGDAVAVPVTFRSTTTGPGIAVVELNLP